MPHWNRLFENITRRRVVPIVVVYAGAGWVVAEASQFLVENYDLPRAFLDAVVYLLVVGFPTTVVIAWYHGERGAQRPTRTEVALLSVLAIIGLTGAYQIASAPRASDGPSAVALDLGEASVAVIPFDNQIADPEMAWLGQGLAELLTTGLAQLNALRVVSGQRLYDLLRQEGREGADAIPDELAMRLSRRAGARYMVRGTVLGRRDDITLNASLINLQSGEVAAAARARGPDAFAVVDEVSAELSAQILGGDREATGRAGRLLAAELAPVAEITTQDIEAYRAYQQGLEAERRFRTAEAKAHYARAVQLDPGFALAHLRLGSREFEEGNNSRAIQQLQLAKQNLTPEAERDRLLVDGLLAWWVHHDAGTARENLQSLVDRYPDDKEARYFLWQIAEGDERQRLIEEAIRLDPFYATAYNYLAYHLADKQEFAAADSAIARYVALEPTEPNPRDSRGEIYERAGALESARASYREALEIEPTFLWALDHLTRSYLREGRAADARGELEAYLPAPAPEVSARLQVLIGDTYAYEGAFDEAIGRYQQAEELGVANQRPELRIEGLSSVAWTTLFTGRYAEAEEAASVLYGIDPFSETALRVAVTSAGEQGAIEQLERLVEDVVRVLRDTEAFRELGLGRYEPELLEALLRYYRGEPGALVATFDRLKAEVGAPLDQFVNWEEVSAHLELGNGERALGLTRNLKNQIEWEGRYRPLTRLRLLYQEGRALQLLGRDAEAGAAYEKLVSQLGSALKTVPRLADTPQRLARVQAGRAP